MGYFFVTLVAKILTYVEYAAVLPPAKAIPSRSQSFSAIPRQHTTTKKRAEARLSINFFCTAEVASGGVRHSKIPPSSRVAYAILTSHRSSCIALL